MAGNTLSYDEIVGHFEEKTIRDRYRFLYEKMQTYIEERGWKDVLYINEAILQQLIMDYFSDIYRLKVFHKISQVNKAKILSYEIHWILRRKPLQIIPSPSDAKQQELQGDLLQKLVFANEGFCVTLVNSEFLSPYVTEPLSPEVEDRLLGYLEHLYYGFKYRYYDKQTLETLLYTFDVARQCPCLQ